MDKERHILDKFVNLHVHTVGSLLDGLTKPTELVDRTLQLEQPAFAVTDHGVMFSIPDTAQYAEKKGQKFIPGFEAYTVENHLIKNKEERSSETEVSRKHLLILAKNNDGYKRMMKICSEGMTNGFYYRPRIDDKVLEQFGTDGLICCSACIAGSVSQMLLHDDYDGAKAKAEYYARLFKDGFYLEIQPTYGDDGRQIKVNKGLIELSKEIGLPLVATTDAHYLKKEDREAHDMLLCIQSHSKLADPNRWKFPGDTFYIMSREEILNQFKINGHETLDQHAIEEAVDNTVEIANQCNVTFKWGDHKLPKISPPSEEEEPELIPKFKKFEDRRVKSLMHKENISLEEAKKQLDDSAEYLRFLCIHGPYGSIAKNKVSKEYRDRLEYELGVINEMGFPSYFLIVYDIMDFCRKENIATGPARGCFLPNNKIELADKSFKNLADIKIGDKVFTHDECIHTVTQTHEFECDEGIIGIETEDGKQISGATANHKVYAIKKDDYEYGVRQPQWYMLSELEEGDYIAKL
jgi:DNA polymerase-3 subunit alpha